MDGSKEVLCCTRTNRRHHLLHSLSYSINARCAFRARVKRGTYSPHTNKHSAYLSKWEETMKTEPTLSEKSERHKTHDASDIFCSLNYSHSFGSPAVVQ